MEEKLRFLKIFDKTISIVEKNAKHIDKYSDDVILKKITPAMIISSLRILENGHSLRPTETC